DLGNEVLDGLIQSCSDFLGLRPHYWALRKFKLITFMSLILDLAARISWAKQFLFSHKDKPSDRHIDCLEVVKAIQEGYSVSSNTALLQRIQLMLQSRNHWVIKHVPRECNQVADLIAKM
ncbi:hypothetical protein Goarm_020102, partial [Gossypium armourianum]|nr:hypothetical protein [Gossypium armourianum]